MFRVFIASPPNIIKEHHNEVVSGHTALLYAAPFLLLIVELR